MAARERSSCPRDVGEDGVAILGGDDALIRRGAPWSWAISAYATEVPDNRWIQDRQNLLDVFHDELGLVAGGGNTKLQPYWSTFAMGDMSGLRWVPGVENPDFTPETDLVWTPASACVRRAGDGARLEATLAPRPTLRREVLLAEGFEEAPVGGWPEGWRSFGREGEGTMAATGDLAHGGERSLRFVDHSSQGSLGLRSPQLPAVSGSQYVAEAWWRGEKGNDAAIYLEFWDAKGQRLQEGLRAVSCEGRGEWGMLRAGGAAPAEAVAVTVLLYSSVAATTEGYFDDATVVRLVPEDHADRTAECSLDVRAEGEELVLTYRAPQGAGVQAHLPLMVRSSRLELGTGEAVPLAKGQIEIPGERTGGSLVHAGLRVSVPEGAFLRWPALHFTPYTKDGTSPLRQAKIVLAMPFADTGVHTVRLAAVKPEPFAGLVFEARDLPFEHSEGTYTKRLDNLGSQFVGNTQPGSWLRFALPRSSPAATS